MMPDGVVRFYLGLYFCQLKAPSLRLPLSLLKMKIRDFTAGPLVKDSTLPMQEAWVPSLVGEQRSCMLHDAVKNKEIGKNLK